MSADTHRYTGFISYSQKDKVWAKRLHKALEAYRLPIGLPEPAGAAKRKLGRFFRDDEELSGAASLGAALDQAIDGSKALIVVCSPNAAQSKWVDAEIRRFKSKGENAKVLAIIVGGKPDATSADEQCFPPSLLSKVSPDGELTGEADEPLAPDASKDPFPKLVTRIVAGLLDVKFDTLWQREKRRILRTRMIGSVAAAALITAGVFGLTRVNSSKINEQRAESVRLALSAQNALDEGRWDDALRLTVKALPESLSKPNKPIVPEATAVLRRLMTGNSALGIVREYQEPIKFIRYFDDVGLVIATESGVVEIVDPTSQTVSKTFKINPASQPHRKTKFYVGQWVEGLEGPPGTWTDTQLLNITDLSTGETLVDYQEPVGDWLLMPTLSESAELILAKRYPSEGRTKLGIFNTNSDMTSPLLTTQLPFETDNYISYEFYKESHLVFLEKVYGQAKAPPNAYIWSLDDNDLINLAIPEAENCPGFDKAYHSKKKPKFQVSPDAAIASWSVETSEENSCVARWGVATQKPLPLISIENYDSRVILPVSDTVTASFWKEALYRTPFGGETTIERFSECGRIYVQGASGLLPSMDKWNYDVDNNYLACPDGKDIYFLEGEPLSLNAVMSGHNEEVSMTVVDSQSNLLWSASKDNTVREWRYTPQSHDLSWSDKLRDFVHDKSGAFATVTSKTQSESEIQIFNAEGRLVSGPIPFDSLSIPNSERYKFSERQSKFFNDAKTLLITEQFCRFRSQDSDCPRDWRLTLIDTKDGNVVRSLSDVMPVPFYGKDKRDLSYRISEVTNEIMVATRPDQLTLISLSGDKDQILTVPENQVVYDIAYAGGTWWVSTREPLSEYGPDPVRILRLEDGAFTEQAMKQGYYAEFHVGPNQDNFLIELKGPAKTTAQWIFSPEHGLQIIDLQPLGLKFSEISSVFIGNNQNSVTVLPENYGTLGPMIEIDPATGTASVQNTAQFKSVLDGYTTDPSVEFFISKESAGYKSQLRIRPTHSNAKYCEDLDKVPLVEFTPVISPSGKHLVLKTPESGATSLQVYDLETCGVVFSTASIGNDSNRVFFSNDETLWVETSSAGYKKYVLGGDLDTMLLQGQRLLKRMNSSNGVEI
ncbi:toll/interleukin-1 receptor domain-containing protein, partial [Hellea sp.]|nr:toll/interleukin-1 receptor domain-containing protein [Hellea sp.]